MSPGSRREAGREEQPLRRWGRGAGRAGLHGDKWLPEDGPGPLESHPGVWLRFVSVPMTMEATASRHCHRSPREQAEREGWQPRALRALTSEGPGA